MWFFSAFFRYKFQTQSGLEDKTATLSDSDTVWTELRHMHMREAIDKLMADFNQFLQDNAGFKGCVISLDPESFVTNLLTCLTRRAGRALRT